MLRAVSTHLFPDRNSKLSSSYKVTNTCCAVHTITLTSSLLHDQQFSMSAETPTVESLFHPIEPKSPLGLYRVLDPLAGIRVSSIQLGAHFSR